MYISEKSSALTNSFLAFFRVSGASGDMILPLEVISFKIDPVFDVVIRGYYILSLLKLKRKK
jgi:hypothetical protein